MSQSSIANSNEVVVITSSIRGLGFMTVVPAQERDGQLVMRPRDGETLRYTETDSAKSSLKR